METVKGLKYSKDHEWVKIEGGTAIIGITDFAQHSLGEIVYIELPEAGDDISLGGVLSSVDSVKAASDVFSPVSGKVIKVNEALSDTPGIINEKPYESWIAQIEMEDASETDTLMDAEEYEEFCAAEE